MPVLILILLLVAFGCFLGAALGAVVPRINLVALGLACWALVLLVKEWPG